MPAAADEFQKAQEAEYGTYVAVEPINIDGVRAFNPGDPVPKGHVDTGAVEQSQVTKLSNTKAAKAATGQEG